MSHLIVAKFNNQFAAASAFDKLMSCGLSRGKGVVQCDESVGRSAASASAPTTVISDLSHRGEREGEKKHLRAPDVLPPPMEIGFAVLSVEIDDDASLDQVTAVMRELSAVDVQVLPGQSLTQDAAALWPEQPTGDRTEVERAILASQHGRQRLH